jgi:hypothetical protein
MIVSATEEYAETGTTHKVRYLAERLLFKVLWRLVRALGDVDNVEFKRNVLLVEDERGALGRG